MARDGRRLFYNGKAISVFPDYPEVIAKARGAFVPIKQLLKRRSDVRYGIKYPATFIITHNGVEKQFTDAVAAMDCAKLIVENCEPPPPENDIPPSLENDGPLPSTPE